MKIEIWSDIVCPWCYIGKRRLESALAQFAHPDPIEIIWRSFELDRNAPLHFEGTADERLAKKYEMSIAQAAVAHDRVTGLAAEEGVEFRYDITRYGNTFDAHRLIHLAAEHGLQGAMEERLFKAYFTEGLAISDTKTLVQLAAEVGLDAEETRSVLEGNDFASEVREDEDRAVDIGVTGVPFFLINGKYGVSGAQPSGAFLEVLEKAGS